MKPYWFPCPLTSVPALGLAFVLYFPFSALAILQQQYITTQTVVQNALLDGNFPGDPNTVGHTNEADTKEAWTNNNQNVRADSAVKIEFSDNVQIGMGYITFQPPIISGIGTSSSAATTIPVPNAAVTVSGKELIINSARVDSFTDNVVYTMSVDAGVVLDTGITVDTNAAFSVQFTVGDFEDPIRNSINPILNAPAEYANALKIVLTFNEAMVPNPDTSLKISLHELAERTSPHTLVVSCNDPSIVVDGNVVTWTPDPSYVVPCQIYELTFVAKCFYDASANKNWAVGLSTTENHHFWTGCITVFSPVKGSLNNLISTDIILTFYEEIADGTGNIVLTPLGESPIDFDVTDPTRVFFNVPATKQVTLKGDVLPEFLCVGTVMQDCKGKPIDVSIGHGVFKRVSTTAPSGFFLVGDLQTQLAGSDYRITMKPDDLTPPIITIVSMYGISENVIRVTVRLDESGTTYCRAYDEGSFSPVSQGGTDVPTRYDCPACLNEINTNNDDANDPAEGNFVGNAAYDNVKKFSEHEVDITHLTDKTFYWVYCYSIDIEIPDFNVVTSSQMLATERKIRTLDTTPPTFTHFACVPTPGTEDSVTVTLAMSEAGRSYCKVVNRDFVQPSPNAVIAEAFYTDTVSSSNFDIVVDQITTGLGATGMEPLFRKTDYDVYCWSQDAEGYPYHGPNGMATVVACPDNHVTTLDLTRPNMRFIYAESISKSQIIITLQVDEGAKVWCAAWDAGNNPAFASSADAETKIKANVNDCMDNKGRRCGDFWIYDLDDLEDTALDSVSTQAQYDSKDEWKFNQDFDIIVYNLNEQAEYPHIYCFAEDDEQDGVGDNPNKMIYDASSNTGPQNVYTIGTAIGAVTTLDETPPTFTKLSIYDPSAHNDRIIVTFQLDEPGTAYCRVTRSDSGENTLRINRILSADYEGIVTSSSDTQYITIDKLEKRDTVNLYEAAQYDVYCWAKDSAKDTQGLSRPNYQSQDYVDEPVGTAIANAHSSPQGGKTTSVWVADKTPPVIIFVSKEALKEDTIQITLQLNEPGTVWCQPVHPTVDGTWLDKDDVVAGNYEQKIKGQSGLATFKEFVPHPFINVDVHVDKVEDDGGTTATPLTKETPYKIYCFAEDDWEIEATSAGGSINFENGNVLAANPVAFIQVANVLTEIDEVITLDLTPPIIDITGVATTEDTITVSVQLDEPGTVWCQAVRKGFNVPTILEILDTNFFSPYASSITTVLLTGYDRPKNAYNSYVTPLVLGTDYDVYCYAEDDLCQGCKVTNGVSFSHVNESTIFARTKDLTRPNMRYVFAESIAKDQIIITLQVDEGAKVWCAAWDSDPNLVLGDYESSIKNWASGPKKCEDNKGRTCGSFWVYDLDDIEDGMGDGLDTREEYDKWENWKYNQDVDVVLYGLSEETDYTHIYCFAQDDETDGAGNLPNPMHWLQYAPGDNGTADNVYHMGQEIGTVQTLDETPPEFAFLAIEDPTEFNDRVIVTFQLNEAGTTYCRVTRSDSGETTLRINQVLSANFGASVNSPSETGYITIDKLESRDTKYLYEASQYDVYCWSKDSAVNTQNMPRPNYMIQDYLDEATSSTNTPLGGKTRHVWVKDTTPPTIIYVSSEALSETTIQITLQLNEPGTVWCHPTVSVDTGPYSTTHVDISDVTDANFVDYIKGRAGGFREFVHVPFYNVDVEVNKIDQDSGAAQDDLLKETPYNIYCFAEDDWYYEATGATDQSINFQNANVNTPNMTSVGAKGNEVDFGHVEEMRDAIGVITTLDLTPPVIDVVSVASGELDITVSVRLDESGTIWCQAVRTGFNPPTILEILDTDFKKPYTYDSFNPTATEDVVITGYDRPKNHDNSYVTPLVLGTDYDVYCYADDDLCLGCKVTNGVTFGHVQGTMTFIRTKDLTPPNMRYITAESIAHDKILITLQVDEGAKVWCAAWETVPSPAWTSTADAITAIQAKQEYCHDGRGNECGNFWVFDLDDIEDGAADGVSSRAQYDEWGRWRFNQDVDIIVDGLNEEVNHTHIFCYAEDDEASPNTMIFDAAPPSPSPNNMHTMQEEIGTVETLDETPPTFTRLALKDPTADNDRLVVTFQLNEAGTVYCRTTRSDSGETTLRINQILTADFSESVPDDTMTGYITIDKLESRDAASLFEAAQYDVYCWAKDDAKDTQGMARPNYMTHDYVETPVGATTSAPNGGKTSNVWIDDQTPPVIIVVAREALAEDVIQVTLQLNEPGTIWCQIVDKDSTVNTQYCRDATVTFDPSNPCYFETFIKGVARGGADNTKFSTEVHIPYHDYDIDLTAIEDVGSNGGDNLIAQYNYHIWCFAEDDWQIEANAAAIKTTEFQIPAGPNKIDWAHAKNVRNTIGQVLTLDQTAPVFATISGTQVAETILTMEITLDEIGTVWCMPVRMGFAEPSVNEILQNNEYNTVCSDSSPCVVTMQGLQAKTQYDIWCYAEDDNLYPQRPNGRKFTPPQKVTLWTLDTTPPILTIVSAESPIKADIRVKIKMEEPGQVWCNSFEHGTAYGVIDFSAVVAGGYTSYVGQLGMSPGGNINENVEVVVTDRTEETKYDTYCTAQDTSTLTTINKLTDPTTVSTAAAVGLIETLDQTPPIFSKIGASGIGESTIEVTFQCDEDCRAFCRVTRSDSGETSLSINRILKADYQADWAHGSGDQTIQISRLEDDTALALLERGTLYDTYCWIRDEAEQTSCYAAGAGANCQTYPKPNYQSQAYVDTAFGGTPPATQNSPSGGKMLHVRTPDTTAPLVVFVEAESTEETSITVTLQLDEPGTAYCRAYSSLQTVDSALFTDLTTGVTVYKNTVTNWNNIYRNFEVLVADLSMETKYYVYCVAEDDEYMEGAYTIVPQPTANNKATASLTEATGRFTLDLTPPIITVVGIASASETSATVTLQLDEPGTVWCKAVRDQFVAPTINQIIAANFQAITTAASTNFGVLVQNLERDTEYDVYCHARDRGTEVDPGVPLAGNPGNDVSTSHMLTTKRDIHTMGDSTPPIIVSKLPVLGDTSVATNPLFKLVFNEDIQAGSGNIIFTPLGGTPLTLDIAQANTGTCVGTRAKVTVTLNVLSVDFNGCSLWFAANTKYYVNFAAGVITDDSYAQNQAPAFGSSNSYYFTTTAR